MEELHLSTVGLIRSSLALQCIYGCNDGGENGDRKEGKEWRLPDLLYTDDLVLCGELEKDLREMVGWFVEV